MSAMDHSPTSGWGGPHDKRCIYCHEPWPCFVAKTRRELAEYLRDQSPEMTVGLDYAYEYDCAIGMAAAAIDINDKGN